MRTSFFRRLGLLSACLVLSLVVTPAMAETRSVDELPSITELPDPFLKPDGSRVASKEEWEQQRQHLRELILRYEYGELPERGDPVTAEEVSSKKLPSGATEKELVLKMGPGGTVTTRVLLTIPPGDGPFPAIIRGDLGWDRVSDDIQNLLIERGYVLAQFTREDIAADKKDEQNTGIYVAYPDFKGGALSAWAWGFHRLVDYLFTLEYVDKDKIAVTGHSRGGKTSLLAGATDERIALTNTNNSGCGGAGCYRLQADKSEDIAAILKNFPYWFAPDFGQFIGKIDRLPFDQHTVKALVAPRALLSTEALGDLWANPKGTQQSHMAAKEVYKFLGAEDRIGIHFREGKHQHNLYDWETLLDFADHVFFGKEPQRRYDEPAFPDAKPEISWAAPRPAGQ